VRESQPTKPTFDETSTDDGASCSSAKTLGEDHIGDRHVAQWVATRELLLALLERLCASLEVCLAQLELMCTTLEESGKRLGLFE